MFACSSPRRPRSIVVALLVGYVDTGFGTSCQCVRLGRQRRRGEEEKEEEDKDEHREEEDEEEDKDEHQEEEEEEEEEATMNTKTLNVTHVYSHLTSHL